MALVTSKQRGNLVTLAKYLVLNRDKVHYAEVRPMRTNSIRNLAQLHRAIEGPDGITCDCSESITFMYRMCKLEDPNGLNYDGDGFTGTMLAYLPHFENVSEAHAGTIVVFGDYPGVHAIMVVVPDGSDPLCFSHGGPGGPTMIRLTDCRTGFPGMPVTFLQVMHL